MIPTGPHKKCLTVNYSISDDKEVIRTVDSEKKKTNGQKYKSWLQIIAIRKSQEELQLYSNWVDFKTKLRPEGRPGHTYLRVWMTAAGCFPLKFWGAFAGICWLA